MKKHFISLLAGFTAMVMSCSMISCGDDPIDPEPEVPVTPDKPDTPEDPEDPDTPDTPDVPTPEVTSQTFTVNGVSFTMVDVEGGTFTMGATPEQGSDAYDHAKPTHSVTLYDYAIGQTEVTQALWTAVMGPGTGSYDDPGYPMNAISWFDCQIFIRKLNILTGKKFRLPTEAEWEYAARGGKYSKGYKYSGSNNLDEVAWHDGELHRVQTKQPNEISLYDMTGNVEEWCYDWYGDYHSTMQTNPTGPVEGDGSRVVRGGATNNDERGCLISTRNGYDQDYSEEVNLGFRLVLGDAVNPVIPELPVPDFPVLSRSFTVKGISFTMIEVPGGTFTMGATPEQGTDAEELEKPAHSVTLSDYCIGQTEVTQELWFAVMGWGLDSPADKDKPVHGIHWDACKEFITKLNELTGETFRFPTEAEWEFAARGGNYTLGYKYSGSDNVDEVAWYGKEVIAKVQTVATKKANELGIYDMSGNVAEWCSDWLGAYSGSALTNPIGPNGLEYKCYRGLDVDKSATTCRVSFRGGYEPAWYQNYFSGFRLAM